MKVFGKTSEKGVALIFALGILGLMTVLALTFASLSMTNQQIAQNLTETASAKMLAESLPSRVCNIMTQLGENIPLWQTSHTQTGEVISRDWLWKLAMTGSSIATGLYNQETFATNLWQDTPSAKENLPQWQYIKDPENGKTIARFAYMAFPINGQIAMSAMLLYDDGSAAYADPEHFKTIRSGIHLASELSHNLLVDNLSNAFDFKKLSQGQFNSYTELETSIPAGISLNDSDKQKLVNAIAPKPYKYAETFFIESDNKAYHRIDLTKITQLIAGTTASADRLALLQQLYQNGLYYEYSGAQSTYEKTTAPKIPHFASFPASQSKQIVANFMDFFSYSDMDITSDVPQEQWERSIPTYTGIKKGPQISGLAFSVDIKSIAGSDEDPANPSNYIYRLSVAPEVQAYIELANIFGKLTPAKNYTVSLTGTLNIELRPAFSADEKNLPLASTLAFSYPITTGAVNIPFDFAQSTKLYFPLMEPKKLSSASVDWANNYTTAITSSTQMANAIGANGSKLYFQVDKFQLQDAKIILNDGTRNIDIALPSDINFFADGSNPKPTDATASSASNTDKEFSTISMFASIRPTDPCVNLQASSWDLKKTDFSNSGALSIVIDSNQPDDTKGIISGYFTETYASKGETFQDADGNSGVKIAANLGTLYYRAKPIGTFAEHDFKPWELAFIHKSQALEFFNFAATADSITNNTTDLDLLDQLKITWNDGAMNAYTFGKVATNSLTEQTANALNALLDKATAEDPTELPDAISAYVTPSITLQNIKDFISARTSKFKSRKDFFANQLFYDLADSTTHPLSPYSMKTKVVSSLAFLLDVEPTTLPHYVCVIGITQTIKKVNSTANSSASTYQKGYLFKIGTTDYLFPENSDTADKSIYNNGIDKITGQQKVIAILEREYTSVPYSATNQPKWKVVQVKYVD